MPFFNAIKFYLVQHVNYLAELLRDLVQQKFLNKNQIFISPYLNKRTVNNK